MIYLQYEGVSMFCSKCGAENPEEAKFCSRCGAALGLPTAAKPEPETTVGISPNLAGFLCYVGLWITGIVFVLLERKNAFVKFHAWQSIMTFLALTVVQIALLTINSAIPPGSFVLWRVAGVFSAFSVIVWLIIFGLWIALMILAYQGKMWRVPWVGDWAERQANK
jgi:uncharacterized membrane protein